MDASESEIKRILGVIGSQNGSASREALKTIRAISANSPVVKERLDFVAKHSLNDPQVELSDEEREIVEGWLAKKAKREP